MSANTAIVFCDGACAGNQHDQNVGGWGAVIQKGREVVTIYGGEANTTNNRMELTACIKALQDPLTRDIPVIINSDSAYLVNCMNQKWYVKWRKNGWLNSKKQPVENQDLWEVLLGLTEQKSVKFVKVKGHAGIELNEKADGLANQGMDEFPNGGETRIGDGEGEEPQPENKAYSYKKVPGGYLLRLHRGFRVNESLIEFLEAQKIESGCLQAIGAIEDIELGYYFLDQKKYGRQKLEGVWEVVSFMGNISFLDGKTFVHAHAMLSDENMNSRGGHFFEGLVAVTLEVYIQPFPDRINREFDEETGLFLLDLN